MEYRFGQHEQSHALWMDFVRDTMTAMNGIQMILPALALFGWVCVASQGQSDGLPATTNVRNAQSPRVFPDGRAQFTLKASDAKIVELAGAVSSNRLPMTKNADGVWSITTTPVVPGFHYYWFLVDGVQMNDPGSMTYMGYGKETSGIEIPEPGVDFYNIKHVPHGEVRAHWYFSKISGEWRRCFVYTPPGYDNSSSTRYPLLILQHGSGEDETGWVRQGKANFILDNLIAGSKSKPMIVVMDRGYATRAGQQPANFGPGASQHDYQEAFRAFQDVVLNDLIPDVDKAYRTIPDREHRAMAGLSMGGMQTLFITLHRPEDFAYIGSFSGPIIRGINTGNSGFDTKTAFDRVFSDPHAFNKRVKLLWLGVGTEEGQFRTGIKAAADALREAGVNLIYFESQGTAHEWQTWRRDLHDFAPRLFQ
jgi:enterochelin esterase-like enzyme